MEEQLFLNVLGNKTNHNRKEVLPLTVATWLEVLVLLLWLNSNSDFGEKIVVQWDTNALQVFC